MQDNGTAPLGADALGYHATNITAKPPRPVDWLTPPLSTPREPVRVWSQDYYSGNCLRASSATTGDKGGDYGHGGATRIRLQDFGSTGWAVSGDGYTFEQPTGITLDVFGDGERVTLAAALRFLADTIDP